MKAQLKAWMVSTRIAGCCSISRAIDLLARPLELPAALGDQLLEREH